MNEEEYEIEKGIRECKIEDCEGDLKYLQVFNYESTLEEQIIWDQEKIIIYHNVWVCKICKSIVQIDANQMTIDEYKQK